MPKIAPFTSTKEAVKQHPCLKILSTEEKKLLVFCDLCGKSFHVSKSNHIADHCASDKHIKNANLNKLRQSNLTHLTRTNKTTVVDQFFLDLTESWIDAGLPLSALDREKLHGVLQNGFKRVIPSSVTLANNYASTIYDQKLETLKDIVASWPAFYIEFDEAEYLGNKYYVVLIGKLDNDKTHLPYLLNIERINIPPNNIIVQQQVMTALSKLGATTYYTKFRLFLTDGVQYNILAGENLKTMYPNIVHVTCFAHMLSRVCCAIADAHPNVQNLVKSVNKFFKNSVIHKNLWTNFGNGGNSSYPIRLKPVGEPGLWLLNLFAIIGYNCSIFLTATNMKATQVLCSRTCNWTTL